MSAGARTDADPMVVVTTLEQLEKLLKKLNGRGLVMDDRVTESLLVTVDDIFSNNVNILPTFFHYCLSPSSSSYSPFVSITSIFLPVSISITSIFLPVSISITSIFLPLSLFPFFPYSPFPLHLSYLSFHTSIFLPLSFLTLPLSISITSILSAVFIHVSFSLPPCLLRLNVRRMKSLKDWEDLIIVK